MFPSTWTYVHRGVPPINGSKYIITGWWMVANKSTFTSKELDD